MRLPRVRLASLVVGTVVLLSACGAPGSPPQTSTSAAPTRSSGDSDNEPARGGTLTIGIGGYPATFNYNLAGTAPAYSMYAAMSERLVKARTDGAGLDPSLAVSWELIDETTWQFKLREGVTWHDGSPFTAEDVVATIDLVLNGEPASYFRTRISDAVEAQKIDDFTVNIITSKKSAILPVGMAEIYIYQAAQIEEGGNDLISAEPLGTGPFKLVEREEGVSVTLDRYDGYWGEAPHLDRVVFRALPEDSTRVAALQRGEIDLAYNVPPDDAPRLEETDEIAVVSKPIGQMMMLQFPLESPRISADSPLRNPLVRQALNYAVDRAGIIAALLDGHTEPALGQILGQDGLGHNPDLAGYSYDPDKARELLAEAGYEDGFSLTITTAQGRYIKQLEISQAIAGQLREVGVDVTLDVIEWSALAGMLTTSEMESYYVGWNYYPVMDGDFVVQNFVCDSPLELYCNEDFDRLFVEERTNPDPDERASIMREMMEILHDDPPAIFMFQSPDIFGVRSGVHGFEPTSDDVVHVETIWVDPAS